MAEDKKNQQEQMREKAEQKAEEGKSQKEQMKEKAQAKQSDYRDEKSKDEAKQVETQGKAPDVEDQVFDEKGDNQFNQYR
ncbi:hypothetical protein ACFOLA_00830 [Salinicoccus hispanicus]|uniref:Uncharacterized protein n=1 Tax=Salinicoccus hispanicus TaxID=157225 RepID=A0A6N8TYM9_9STAP|nr:hypothetical protein [Salinicoccus hispanicus]MXQ50127.1 hypothetical protein [Salinicoccus hispanicus]